VSVSGDMDTGVQTKAYLPCCRHLSLLVATCRQIYKQKSPYLVLQASKNLIFPR